MRRVLYSALFLLAFSVPLMAQDAVKADPNHYKVEFENARVRVLQINYGPGEKSVMHSHPEALAMFQTDGRVKFTHPDGKTEEREFKAGQILWTPAGRHLPENISGSAWEVLLVEMKTPKRKPRPKKPAANTNQ